MFLLRANAADVDGVVALYEPLALLVGRNGEVLVGTDAIRRFYEKLLATRPQFTGKPQPVVRQGDLALTSTQFRTPSGRTATAEVARRQPDGTWLWAIDNPNVLA
jgi:ketosteroid isomerase-like protein